MKQIVNTAYKPFFTENKRYKILMGGRAAGRSTVASQYANARLTSPEYFRCAIMRYILGDVRNSIYREILDRADENNIRDSLGINDSMMTINYGANSINAMGFKKSSGEQKAKLKSLANYNCVIIEEADEIGEEDFNQLDDTLRTVKGDLTIILLLNPPSKDHWIVKRWFDLEPIESKDFYKPVLKKDVDNVLFIHTTYKDNSVNISEDTKVRYEEYSKTNISHYYNMIRGYILETVKGKIFNNWQKIDKVPHEARLVRRGLDFGYSVDPAAVVAVYQYNGGYILDEEVYSPGMSNKLLADTILAQTEPSMLVIADSSEPKSIDEMKLYGVNMIGAVKGPDSIDFGIKWMQSLKISYTARSINLEKEYESYSWLLNKDGENMKVPKPGNDHIIDSCRYALTSIKPPEKPRERVYEEPETPMYSSIGL